jgi:hypothetical protein
LQSEHWSVRGAYLIVIGMSLLSIGHQVLPITDYFPVDFKYFWMSGALWLDETSPYGPEFEELGRAEFPGERINPFFYPPNWRAVTSMLALLSPARAELIWAALSGAAIIAACWQMSIVSSVKGSNLSRWRLFAVCLFLIGCVTHSVDISILIGQPAPFILLAFTSLLLSIVRSNPYLAAIAMTILLMKPQLSIALAAIGLLIPSLRGPTVVAGTATGALALFGLGFESPVQNFLAFLNNISLYNTLPENWPIHMSGPDFLLAVIGLNAPNAFVWVGVSVAASMVAAFYVARRPPNLQNPDIVAALVLFSAVATVFIMPTHNFDFLMITPALCFVIRYAQMRMVGLVGLFLVARSMSFSVVTEEFIFEEKASLVGLYDTIGSGLLLFYCGWILWRLCGAHSSENQLRVSLSDSAIDSAAVASSK